LSPPLGRFLLEVACRAMDAPMPAELLAQIPYPRDIGRVTTDGVFDTCKCHDAIATRDAQAVLPTRKNTRP